MARIEIKIALEIITVRTLYFTPSLSSSTTSLFVKEDIKLVEIILPTAEALNGIKDIISLFKYTSSKRNIEKTNNNNAYAKIAIPSKAVIKFDTLIKKYNKAEHNK